jgi:hypothetical protein
MKIKLLFTAILLISFQNFFAQETPVQVVLDSSKTKVVDIEKQKAEEKARLEQQLK